MTESSTHWVDCVFRVWS